MGFVNAYLTEEEKALFEAAKIPDPVCLRKGELLMPDTWTVDREKNIALVYCGVPDREEHNIEVFALLLKGISKEQLAIIRLKREYKPEDDEYEKLKVSLNVNIIFYWKFIDIINSVSAKRIESELTAALNAYGLDGRPDRPCNSKSFVDF